jgi:uncharacterized protein (DUF58 family)
MIRRALFHNFRLVYTLDRWLRQRFTKAGFLVLMGLVCAIIFGVDTQQSLAYQLGALLSSVLLIAIVHSWFIRLGFKAVRELPRFATVGENFYYRLKVYNHTAHSQAGISIVESIAQIPPSYSTFLHAKEPLRHTRNWFDNYIGYPRWMWLMYYNRGANTFEQAAPVLPLGNIHATEVEMHLLPLRRGYVHLRGLNFICPDPFGICNRIYHYKLPEEILVLPKRYSVPPLNILGRRKYQRGGVQLAMAVGDSQEFVSLRDYRAGDPLRNIHWKSFAKSGKPVVKEYQDEFFIRHALLLDTFTPTSVGEQFEAAVSIAASLACAPRHQDALLDLLFVGNEAYCFTSGRGLSSEANLLEVLACVEPNSNVPFSSLQMLLAQHSSLLSACIGIFLNWDEERAQLLKTLEMAGVAVLILLVCENAPENLPSAVHQIRPHAIAEDLNQLS